MSSNEININNLPGEYKRWAEEADDKKNGGNSDGKLNSIMDGSNEESYVIAKAVQAGKTAEDIHEVLGITITIYNPADSAENTGISQPDAAAEAARAEGVSKSDPAVEAAKPDEVAKAAAKPEVAEEAVVSEGPASTTQSEASKKANREYTLTRVLDIGAKRVGNLNWASFIEDLTQDLKKLAADNPYYNDVIKQVELVSQKVMEVNANLTEKTKDSGYNSRNEILHIYDMVMSQLAELPNDEFKNFRKSVLDNFKKLAEADQIKKETVAVAAQYNDLANHGYSREEAVDLLNNATKLATSDKYVAEVKEKLIKKGYSEKEADNVINTVKRFRNSYFQDYEDKSKWADGHAVPRKGVLTSFAEQEVMKLARNEVWDYIYAQRDSGLTNPSDVKKAAKAAMERAGSFDKFAKKAMGGERSFKETINFEESTIDAFASKVAIENRAEELKNKPLEEKYFFDKLNNDALFEGLKNADLVTVREGVLSENGQKTYDLTELSNTIRKTIGANLKADRQLSEFKVLSEIQRTMDELLGKIDSQHIKLSTSDVKNIIRLCGYDVEGKNWWKVLVDTIDKTFLNGLVGTAAALSTPQELVTGSVSGKVNGTVNGSVTGSVSGTVHGTVSGITTGDVPFNINVELNNSTNLVINLTGVQLSKQSYATLVKDLLNQGFRKDDISSYTEYLETGKIVAGLNTSSYESYEDVLKGVQLAFEKDYSKDYTKSYTAKYSQDYEKEYEKDYEKKAGKKSMARMLYTQLMFSFATNFLQSAMKEKAEIPAFITQFDKETTLNEFEAMVRNKRDLSPDMKDGICALAQAFKTDNGWDSEGFKNELNRFAGDGGILNSKEAAIGLYEANAVKKPEPEKKPLPLPVPEVDLTLPNITPNLGNPTIVVPELQTPVKPKPEIGAEQLPGQSQDGTIPFDYVGNANKHTWQGFVNSYYGEYINDGTFTHSEIVRQIKTENNIDRTATNLPENGLYLPDLEKDGKTYPKKSGVTEADIYKNDAKIEITEINNNRVRTAVKSGQTQVASGKWQGYIVVNGERQYAPGAYDSQAEAEAAARALIEEEQQQ